MEKLNRKLQVRNVVVHNGKTVEFIDYKKKIQKILTEEQMDHYLKEFLEHGYDKTLVLMLKNGVHKDIADAILGSFRKVFNQKKAMATDNSINQQYDDAFAGLKDIKEDWSSISARDRKERALDEALMKLEIQNTNYEDKRFEGLKDIDPVRW